MMESINGYVEITDKWRCLFKSRVISFGNKCAIDVPCVDLGTRRG